MTLVAFDVETVANDFSPDEIASILKGYKPPSNYKDPGKIANHRQEWLEKQIDNAALDPVRSQVIGIGWSMRTTQGIGTRMVLPDQKSRFADERRVLIDFWDTLSTHIEKGDVVCGWMIHSFDLSYLWRRSLLVGVCPWDHCYWMSPTKRYPDHATIDLAEVWGKMDRGPSMLGLATICEWLNIRVKDAGTVEGKSYGAAWLRGWHLKCQEYLRQDVEACIHIYDRFFCPELLEEVEDAPF